MPPRKIKVEEPIIEESELIEDEPIKKIKKVRVKKPVETEIVFVEEPVKNVRVNKEKIERPTVKIKKTSKWLTALKEYNKDRGSYLIPRKGTDEYESVRKMMENMSV